MFFQKKEEAVQVVPALPQNTAAELIEQRKRYVALNIYISVLLKASNPIRFCIQE